MKKKRKMNEDVLSFIYEKTAKGVMSQRRLQLLPFISFSLVWVVMALLL